MKSFEVTLRSENKSSRISSSNVQPHSSAVSLCNNNGTAEEETSCVRMRKSQSAFERVDSKYEQDGFNVCATVFEVKRNLTG